MKLWKYKLQNKAFLIYSEKDEERLPIFEDSEELVFSDILKEENENIPIYRYDLLKKCYSGITRNRDKQLEEYGILYWWQLKELYNLIKCKNASLPRNIRDFVVDKYLEINNEL